MKRLSKEEKRVENLLDAEFKRQGSGVQFNMFDLPKIFANCREELAKSEMPVTQDTAAAAMAVAIALYRKN